MKLWKLIPVPTAGAKIQPTNPGFLSRLFGAKTIVVVDQPVIYIQQPEPLDSKGFIPGDAVYDTDQNLFFVIDIVEQNYRLAYHATNLVP